MDKKPVEALERMRKWNDDGASWPLHRPDATAILAWADSVPEWPKEATREWFEAEAELCADDTDQSRSRILRALAAIAPVKRKRMVNLWQKNAEQTFADVDCDGSFITAGWQKMNRTGPIEIEE